MGDTRAPAKGVTPTISKGLGTAAGACFQSGEASILIESMQSECTRSVTEKWVDCNEMSSCVPSADPLRCRQQPQSR